MKTFKLIMAATLLLGLTLVIFNVTSAKTKSKTTASKKHHHKKPVDQYYLVFVSGGNTYEVHGIGGEFSGNLNWGYEACIGDKLYLGGTGLPATGTYSYNTTTDVMSVNVTGVNFGGLGTVTYSGPTSDYDSSPIDIVCNP
jgi:hypothetical protein